MTTCYQHPRCHVQHEGDSCPICLQLFAKDEAIAALSKLSEEEAKALEFLDKEQTSHAKP